jgi:hypothetical protein
MGTLYHEEVRIRFVWVKLIFRIEIYRQWLVMCGDGVMTFGCFL